MNYNKVLKCVEEYGLKLNKRTIKRWQCEENWPLLKPFFLLKWLHSDSEDDDEDDEEEQMFELLSEDNAEADSSDEEEEEEGRENSTTDDKPEEEEEEELDQHRAIIEDIRCVQLTKLECSRTLDRC